MSKHNSTTAPSHYYEPRKAVAQQPVVIEYRKPRYPAQDGEYIATIIAIGVWGFAIGMLIVAAWAGVL